MRTLVIDTSYGSAVGVVGHEPIVETDSRTHVERLQADIAAACADAALAPRDIERIVVGLGPAPFTGLRAGIVTAKALAFATGAELLGQDDLSVSAALMHAARRDPRFASSLGLPIPGRDDRGPGMRLTLAVNDARRRQLYFALYADGDDATGFDTLIAMDIDHPTAIAARVDEAVRALRDARPDARPTIDVVGHGADRYADAWRSLDGAGRILERTALDLGALGLELFARTAERTACRRGGAAPIEPLYLRRPDVSVPNPLKHVLNHAPARADAEGSRA